MSESRVWPKLLLMCAPVTLACQPTIEELGEDENWLVLSVSTFDEDSSRGVLQLQARGGDVVQMRLIGGTVRDERNEAAATLCLGVQGLAVRRLPFALDGETGTITAALLSRGDGTTAQACADTQRVPLASACCILPDDCGCDGESGGGGAAIDSSSTTSGSDDGSTTEGGGTNSGDTDGASSGTSTGGMG